MRRRDFLKSIGILGLGLTHAPFLIIPNARAKEAMNIVKSEINYQNPQYLPIVINIFLYGGPSELAGNLTNIEEINSRSQNKYPGEVLPSDSDNKITQNWFWGSAGGSIMEELIRGKEAGGITIFPASMTLYRTVYRKKDDNKSHPISITQNLVGNLDMSKPGYAATLAGILATHNPWDKDINQLVLPFVSFEGDSTVFKIEDIDIPLTMKPMMLDSKLNNPYKRSKISGFGDPDFSYIDGIIEQLARETSATYNEYAKKIKEAFEKRQELADFVENNLTNIDDSLPKSPDSNAQNDDSMAPNYDPDIDDNGRLVYPSDNPMAQYLKVAIALAIENKDTVFISVGNGSLGSWDNHSDAIYGYKLRMSRLMTALRCAVKHMYWYSEDTTKPQENRERARRIVINAFGDFGRNVNLNNSMGWDHGNNQNFYTVGGWDIPGRVLGKLVGKTEVFSEDNRLFTRPTADSYSFEPFSIISTVYKYFGVQNPEVITGEPPIDEQNPPNEFV